MLTGLGDHVAMKVPTHSLNAEDKKRLKHAYQVQSHVKYSRRNITIVFVKIKRPA